MSMNNEVARLVSGLIDETNSIEDQTRLIELLKNDTNAREIYLEMLQTDSILNWCATTNLIDISPETNLVSKNEPVTSSIRKQLLTLKFSLAGMLLLCGLLLVALYLKEGTTPVIAAERITSSEGGAVAVITHTEGAQWVKTNLSTIPGKPLQSGWLKLKKGRVYLDFLDGTKAILEGPTELGLNGTNRAFLKSGKLTIQTSSKNRFIVETETLQLTSSNAQIGLIVDENQQTEVHTFTGKVDVYFNSNGQQITLTESEAIQVSSVKEEKSFSKSQAKAELFHLISEETISEESENKKYLTFTPEKTLPYSFQDGQHDLPSQMKISAAGNQLHLLGNAWKRVEVNANLTPETIIEFEFRTDHEGQIHGFGFDDDNQFHTVKREVIFQIHGYEVLRGIGQQFNNYEGNEWRKYRIRVGRYLSGKHRYLFFVADDDVTGKAESFFRNVRLYDATANVNNSKK